MKTLKTLFRLFLSLSIVVSCSKSQDVADIINTNSNIEEFTIIEASQEVYHSGTRTTLQEDGSVFWNPSDEISLFFINGKNGGNKFISQNTETTKIAEFRGTISAITGGGEGLTSDDYFWAIYPYSTDNSCENSSIITTLPSRQQSVESSFADDLFITIARSKGVKMEFYNVCGGVKFCVSQNGIESVTFRGNNNEQIAGKVRVAFDENDKPKVTEIIEGQTEITVMAPNNGEFIPGEFYYIITLPTSFDYGFTMTFNKADNTCIVYNRTSGVAINRSRFGVLRNIDTNEAIPKDESTTTINNSESGFYLGIIGFNEDLHHYPITPLTSDNVASMHTFINGLYTNEGTLLYYAVDNSIDILQKATYPANLSDIAIVTFTDGLDIGSLDMSDYYLTDNEYINAINNRLTNETVSNHSISAYSIGILGNDVKNENKFRQNLNNIATSSSNVFEVANMSEVNEKFSEIADQLSETKYVQQFEFEISSPSNGELCRFTFDNTNSATASQQYIEGKFVRPESDRSLRTLTDLKYVGLTSTTQSPVIGVKNESNNKYIYTFEGIQSLDGEIVPTNNVQHWYTSDGIWELNSEFFYPGTTDISKVKRSAAILLNIDCSSSLGTDFASLQNHAKSFISQLLANAVDPDEVASITLNKSAVTIQKGNTITLKATVLPTTALLKDVEWSSTNTDVASVSANGVVTAHKGGTATIIAKTKDGGLTARCHVSVMVLANAVTLNHSSLEMYNGDTTSLTATISPDDTTTKSVIWSSSNKSVATVDNYGNITALAPGAVTITATANDSSQQKATCSVMVLQHVESITLDYSNIVLNVGAIQQLTPIVKPSNAFNKNVEWTSSDSSVVSVNQNGLLTALKKGSVQISATTTDGGKIATCNINVKQLVESIELNHTSATLHLGIDSSLQLSATINPQDADNDQLLWNSSNTTIASVDQNGLVQILAPGIVTISAKAIDESECSAECVLTIKQPVQSITLNISDKNLYVDETLSLTATVGPADANDRSITWSSSDSTIATVSQSGVIRGIAPGLATIYASANDDSGIVAECSISVSALPQTPINLALSVKKDDIRYFIPASVYQDIDLSTFILSLTDYSVYKTFIVQDGYSVLHNGQYYLFSQEEACEVTIPTKEQADIIVSNWESINSNITYYGGISMEGKAYWTNSYIVVSGGGSLNNQGSSTRPLTTSSTKYYQYYESSGRQGTSDKDELKYVRTIIAEL